MSKSYLKAWKAVFSYSMQTIVDGNSWNGMVTYRIEHHQQLGRKISILLYYYAMKMYSVCAIVNSKHAYIYILHLAFSTCLVTTILKTIPTTDTFYSMLRIHCSPKWYKFFLGGYFSCFQNKMKCVLCACGECECESEHSYTCPTD